MYSIPHQTNDVAVPPLPLPSTNNSGQNRGFPHVFYVDDITFVWVVRSFPVPSFRGCCVWSPSNKRWLLRGNLLCHPYCTGRYVSVVARLHDARSGFDMDPRFHAPLHVWRGRSLRLCLAAARLIASETLVPYAWMIDISRASLLLGRSFYFDSCKRSCIETSQTRLRRTRYGSCTPAITRGHSPPPFLRPRLAF